MQSNLSDALCETTQRLNIWQGWPTTAVMPSARHVEVGDCMLVIMGGPVMDTRTLDYDGPWMTRL